MSKLAGQTTNSKNHGVVQRGVTLSQPLYIAKGVKPSKSLYMKKGVTLSQPLYTRISKAFLTEPYIYVLSNIFFNTRETLTCKIKMQCLHMHRQPQLDDGDMITATWPMLVVLTMNFFKIVTFFWV